MGRHRVCGERKGSARREAEEGRGNDRVEWITITPQRDLTAKESEAERVSSNSAKTVQPRKLRLAQAAAEFQRGFETVGERAVLARIGDEALAFGSVSGARSAITAIDPPSEKPYHTEGRSGTRSARGQCLLRGQRRKLRLVTTTYALPRRQIPRPRPAIGRASRS